jgi:hypothetical protein
LLFTQFQYQAILDWVFLGLCPPSITALALDNASLTEGVIAWFLIALMNAGLYAVAGAVIGAVASGLRGKSN